MSAYTEQRRLTAEFENFEKRVRGLRIADRSKDGAVDDVTSLIDALKDRYTNILEPRGQRSAGVRQDVRSLTLRKARNSRTRDLGDDIAMVEAGLEAARDSGASPSPKVQRASAFPSANGKVANPRRSRSLGTAAIVTIGLAGGLVASKGIWGEAFSFRHTIAIKDATESAKQLPGKTAWAGLRGEISSVLGFLRSAVIDKVEHPGAMSQGRPIAPSAGFPHDDHGTAIEPNHIPAQPSEKKEDAQFSNAATTAPLPPLAAVAAPASMPKAAPGALMTQESATAESHDLGYPASALGEAAQRLTSAFDDAPALDHGSRPQQPKDEVVDKEIKPSIQKNSDTCYVKVEGRVYVNGSCHVFRSNGSSVTFGLADKPVTVAFDHGRTWTATMGKLQLGKVFKRGSCWGNKHVYICEHAI